jgi:hypothetical protein
MNSFWQSRAVLWLFPGVRDEMGTLTLTALEEQSAR